MLPKYHYIHSGNIRAALIFWFLKKMVDDAFYQQPIEYTREKSKLNDIAATADLSITLHSITAVTKVSGFNLTIYIRYQPNSLRKQ